MGGFLHPHKKERYKMATITISRQFGSGGDEIARRVCEILDYRRFDKRMLAQAATEAGLSEQEVIDYSEENYKVRGFLERLFERTPTVATVRVWEEQADGIRMMENIKLKEETLIKLVHRAVRSAHKRGNVVIVGRGGQALLRNEKDVLHVRIIAPLEECIQRMKERLRASRQIFDATIDLRRNAQDTIVEKDAASAAYLKRFYNIDWDNPLLYHLVINTGQLSLEQAALTIADLASRITLRSGEESLSAEPV
jgi:CMP/dCMP kinase